MKTLVVYYSRTGTTRQVGEEIAKGLKAETEEIIDTVDRSGAKGWMISGKAGMKRELTKLKRMKTNPADFDLVVVGTPIWAWNMSAPVRTYLTAFKGKFKRVAFFCTMGSQGAENTFKEMNEVISVEPTTTLALTTKEVTKNNYTEKVKAFIESIKK